MKENSSAQLFIDSKIVALAVEIEGEIVTTIDRDDITIERILELVQLIQNMLGIPFRDYRKEIRRLHDLDQMEATLRDINAKEDDDGGFL